MLETPVKPTTSAGDIDPKLNVALTPVTSIMLASDVESAPTDVVAETPVISLGPNSNPKVPKDVVAALPAIGSVLTPKATPIVPKDTVDDCPSRPIVGLITKLKDPTPVVAA